MARIPDLRFDFVGRGDRAGLDAEEMLAAALKRAGRRDFSDRSFVEALKRLLAAYAAEGDLSAFGRYAARFDVMRSLRNLLHFDAVEERQPELLRRPIERPIFITGLPRSGTTFLHELLIQDPTTAAPLSWQLVYPHWARFGRLGAGLFKTLAHTQFSLMSVLAPELNDLHPVSASAPQECTDITAQVFQSLRFDTLYHIPSYQNWLETHGHLNAYLFHRRFLRHLDAQTPGRRWILKSPDHVFALNEIRAVYPDAHFVFLHRDPVSVLASVAKLTEVLRRPFARRIDHSAIGRQVCASWVDGTNRMIEAAAGSDSILHLHYDQVVSAPIETAAALFQHCGLTLSDEARVRMGIWLGRVRRRQSARRRYSLASFGLHADVVRAQFARYIEAFRVRADWDGEKEVRIARPSLA
jgi:Sulfotransferase family